MKKIAIALLMTALLLSGCGSAESQAAVIVTPEQTIVVTAQPTPEQPVIASNEPTVIIPGISSELPQGATQNTLAEELFRLTNAERLNRGLTELFYNADLQAAADLRAREASELFSHTRPNGSSCHSVVEDFDYYVTGENLIMADRRIADAETLMSEWMNSEGHRQNILLKAFKSVAIGVYERDGAVFAAQIFLG